MTKLRTMFFIGAVLIASPIYAQAPKWSDTQAAVWTVVQQSWQDDAAENGRWPAAYAGENFVAWAENVPTPRDLETYIAWERSTEEISDTIWYEISPLAIAVQGDTAVVMYSLYIGEEDNNGARSLDSLNVVEVLNRDGQNWKYVATVNFSPDSGN